jgi:anti-sigma regulatory factor (Ser/Thr protein kinase)
LANPAAVDRSTPVDIARERRLSTAGAFAHAALVYRGREEYVGQVTGFVRDALAADQPALVAVPEDHLDLVRAALNGVGHRVTFADMAIAGRNPGRIIPGVLLDFADRHRGRRVSIVGEPVWPGRNATEYPACVLHEALINGAFAGRDASILCPYDADGLDDAALADAHRTHPIVTEAGESRHSVSYPGFADAASAFNLPLPPPPAGATTMSFATGAEMADVRRLVVAHARAAGLAADRVADLTFAVNEVVTNTVEHSGGPGRVTLWTEPTGPVCQVDDGGHLADPLAGRVPPDGESLGGRGLVTVNHLCDLVLVHTEPGHTSIRLYAYR